jgi:hypothetical protein
MKLIIENKDREIKKLRRINTILAVYVILSIIIYSYNNDYIKKIKLFFM